MRRALLLSGLWAAVTVAIPTAAQGQGDLLLGIHRMAERGPSRAVGIWPGFHVPTEFILCARNGITLVASSEATVALADRPEVVEDLGGGAVLLSAPPPGLEHVCFDLSYAFGESTLLAVPLLSQLYSVTDPVVANLSQLYHEAFHQFQEKEFAATSESGYAVFKEVRIPVAVMNSPEFGRLAAEERALLTGALREPDLKLKRALLGQYVSRREERLKLVPPDLREAEAHHERKEGTAKMVGLTAAFAVAGLEREEVRDAVVQDLGNTPAFSGQDYMSNAYRRWHVYATGAALGLLLDDFGVAWRERVQDGGTPYMLVVRDVVDQGAATAHGG